jgi:chromosomal replication initiator protein
MSERDIIDVWTQRGSLVPVSRIKRRVAAMFDVSVEALEGPSRHRSVARPRQVAIWLCKQLTRCSFPDIARRFGGRDHTTAMHAVKRVERLLAEDPDWAVKIAAALNAVQIAHIPGEGE